jgi:hypothetical protein
MVGTYKITAGFQELRVKLVCGTRDELIGTHPVKTSHEYVTDRGSTYAAKHELRSDLKSRIGFEL